MIIKFSFLWTDNRFDYPRRTAVTYTGSNIFYRTKKESNQTDCRVETVNQKTKHTMGDYEA